MSKEITREECIEWLDMCQRVGEEHGYFTVHGCPEFLDAIKGFLSNPEPKWLPIESVPKDGSRFLAIDNDNNSEPDIYCFDQESNEFKHYGSYTGLDLENEMTHWQPLPPPPSKGA